MTSEEKLAESWRLYEEQQAAQAKAFADAFMKSLRPYIQQLAEEIKSVVFGKLLQARRRATYYRHPKRRALRK